VSSKSDSINTSQIMQMCSSHEREMEFCKDKNRTVVKHLMDLQDTNIALENALTNRDEKLKELAEKEDHGFVEAMNIEICAMREAFEIKTKKLEKDLITARANTRRANQQLKYLSETHKVDF